MPLPPSLVDTLSQDLIDRLIDSVDELGGAERFSRHPYLTLTTCASVCRAFLSRSQYYLFSSVKLNAERLQEFYEIVKHNPLIAERVRTLHLVFRDGEYDWIINDPKFFSIMKSITQPTTTLYKLKLEGDGLPGSRLKNPQLFLDRVFTPFLAPFIISLDLDSLGKVPMKVIDSCVKLIELTLVFTPLKSGRTLTSPPRHKVTKLEYNDAVQVKQLTTDAPRSRLDLSELRSLYVHTDSLTELKFEQCIIDESSGALEELYFKISRDPECQLHCFVDLKYCPNLRLLDFDINMGHLMAGENENNLDSISRTLSTLPRSTRFDTLRLTAFVGYLGTTVGDPNVIFNADWTGLQSQLANIASGKPFFEFAFRIVYLNLKEEDDGEDIMGDRCQAVLDKVLRETLDILAKNPRISITLRHHVVRRIRRM